MNNKLIIALILASWITNGILIYRLQRATSAMLDLSAGVVAQIITIKGQNIHTQDAVEGLDKKLAETLKKEITKMAFMGVKVR